MGRQNSDLGLVQVWGDTIQILLICAGLGRQNSDTLDLCRFAETKFRDLQCKFKTILKTKNKKRANFSRTNRSWADTAVRRAR